MKRYEAIKAVLDCLAGDEIVISANGMISRELYALRDRPGNFYMLGSMGLASSIGLGLALTQERKKIIVLDGDGNILMNLGSLATIGQIGPENLIHMVLDNEAHDTTGGQPTASRTAKLVDIARACDFSFAVEVRDEDSLKKALKKAYSIRGPSFILVKVEKGGLPVPRVPYSPEQIRERFRSFLKEG